MQLREGIGNSFVKNSAKSAYEETHRVAEEKCIREAGASEEKVCMLS